MAALSFGFARVSTDAQDLTAQREASPASAWIVTGSTSTMG